MSTATMSKQFQIAIPKDVREQQDWQAGQEFVFIPKGKGVLVMPVPTLEDLKGLAEGADGSHYRDREDRQLNQAQI
jgi:AbrB family looped-hinge helix DNA binding protein